MGVARSAPQRGHEGEHGSEPLARVLRWENAGGAWRVLTRPATTGVTVVLDSCYGEEMSRFESSDVALIDWLAGRTSSGD